MNRHEGRTQKARNPSRIAPTSPQPEINLEIDDYGSKLCISIQWMKIISKTFRWYESRGDIAANKTLTVDFKKKAQAIQPGLFSCSYPFPRKSLGR
jgi:hypothetical protein